MIAVLVTEERFSLPLSSVGSFYRSCARSEKGEKKGARERTS